MPHPEEYDLVLFGSGRGRFLAWSLGAVLRVKDKGIIS
jgi:hypothetical protein